MFDDLRERDCWLRKESGIYKKLVLLACDDSNEQRGVSVTDSVSCLV